MQRSVYYLFLFIFAFSVKGWSQTAGDTIDVVYDPTQISIEAGAGRELLEKLHEQMLETQKTHENYFVPVAPATLEELKPFSGLAHEDMETFLAKKQKFLEKISGGVKWFRLPVSMHNKILASLNSNFFASAPTIARANSTGASVQFQIGGGLGLNSHLAQRIEKIPGMSWFPKSGGFFLGLGIGCALSRTEALPGQEARWSFEVFLNLDHLKSVKTFLGIVLVDATVVYVTEDVRNKGRTTNIAAEVIGPIGTLRSSDAHFSFGPGLTLTLPPLLDNAMFYSFHEKRITLLNLELSKIGEFFKGNFKRFSTANDSRPLCQNVFN